MIVRIRTCLLQSSYEARQEESVEDSNKFGNETQLLAKVVQKLAVISTLACR